MQNVKLSVSHITKTYPGVVALDDINIDFIEGEIHALVGENGAGKSTIVKTISGAIAPDSGSIIIDGQAYDSLTPALSKKLGIEIIYQEFNLIPDLTVAENLFLGSFLGNGAILDMKEMCKRTEEIFREMHINISPTAIVKTLTPAYMQMVEIAKAIIKDVKLLIMDEPTAPLMTNEVEVLFEIVNKLKSRGVTIIYISHRLNEIYRITDKVTVMRDGKTIETMMTADSTREKLIRQMVGREVSESFPQKAHTVGEELLRVENLCGSGVQDVSFSVHAGEVLGLAGLVGAGRTEVVRMIFGADPIDSGRVFLDGKELKLRLPEDAVREGIGLVPEDRKEQGVVLGLSVGENISLAVLKDISKFLVVNSKREAEVVGKQIDSLRVKTPSTTQKTKNLSGGNQQKVALGKWLAGDSKILILDEPTRGIDVGAKQEIYQIINELSAKGMGVIVVSSEMDELIGLADRIVVLCEGMQTGELHKEEFSQETILKYASKN